MYNIYIMFAVDFNISSLCRYVFYLGYDEVTLVQHHESHNESDKYLTMHHFVSEICTQVHISVTNSALLDMALVPYGICAIGQFTLNIIPGAIKR